MQYDIAIKSNYKNSYVAMRENTYVKIEVQKLL